MKDLWFSWLILLVLLSLLANNVDRLRAIQELQLNSYEDIIHVDTTRVFVALRTDCTASEYIRYRFVARPPEFPVRTLKDVDVCVGFFSTTIHRK